MQSSSYPHPKFEPGNLCRIKKGNPDKTFWYHGHIGVGNLVEIRSVRGASAVPGENWDYEVEQYAHLGCIGENDLELVAEDAEKPLERVDIGTGTGISLEEWAKIVEASMPKPLPKVIFDPSQILAAAEYLVENEMNAGQSVDKIEDKIYSYIRDEAKSDTHKGFISTSGFTLLFSREGDTLEVNVTVNPLVTNSSGIVLAELDSNDKLVAQYPNR